MSELRRRSKECQSGAFQTSFREWCQKADAGFRDRQEAAKKALSVLSAIPLAVLQIMKQQLQAADEELFQKLSVLSKSSTGFPQATEKLQIASSNILEAITLRAGQLKASPLNLRGPVVA